MKKIKTSIKLILLNLLLMVLCCASAWAEENLCPTLQEFKNEGIGNNCLPCSVYKIILDCCSVVVHHSWNSFASPLRNVVALGAAIYVAVYTLRNVFSFSQQNTMAYLSSEKTGVIPLLFKTAIIILLLENEAFLYTYLISPVITTGLNIGAEIGGESIGTGFSNASSVDALFSSVIDKTRQFNDEAYAIVAFGRLMLCIATPSGPFWDWYWSLIPFGCVLYVFGFLLIIGISFYLIDVLFRLAVGCILLPFAIACGVSKFTSEYTKKNWALFVNVFFNFVMLGLLLSLTMKLITEAVSGANDGIADMLTRATPLNEADVKKIVESINNDLIYNFLRTTVCCMICFKLFMEIEQITDKVSSSSSVGKLGQKIGATAGGAAMAAGGKVLKQPVNFAKAGLQEAGKDLSDSKFGQAIARTRIKTKRAVKKFFGLND